MNTPRFARLIKAGASNAGLGEEEYVNYLIRFFQNPPKEFCMNLHALIEACNSLS